MSEAYNTPKWKEALGAFLKSAYAKVIGELNVATATPAMLRERFKTSGGIDSGTVDLALRFYINGLKAAEIPFSPHLVIRAPRTAPTGARKRASGRSFDPELADDENEPPEGTFRVSFDLLGLAGAAFLPDDIDGKQWEAVSEYVATVIGLRARARKT